MTRFEKDFKAGENVARAVNPADPGKVCILNTSRIRQWANDWVSSFATSSSALVIFFPFMNMPADFISMCSG